MGWYAVFQAIGAGIGAASVGLGVSAATDWRWGVAAFAICGFVLNVMYLGHSLFRKEPTYDFRSWKPQRHQRV